MNHSHHSHHGHHGHSHGHGHSRVPGHVSGHVTSHHRGHHLPVVPPTPQGVLSQRGAPLELWYDSTPNPPLAAPQR
ncbi:uncharacterized protein Dsimw501_GD26922 [Drosophila simulans]|nr:uncharacterized protein Dsimw501_GD26922 [Drosophila simulans]